MYLIHVWGCLQLTILGSLGKSLSSSLLLAAVPTTFPVDDPFTSLTWEWCWKCCCCWWFTLGRLWWAWGGTGGASIFDLSVNKTPYIIIALFSLDFEQLFFGSSLPCTVIYTHEMLCMRQLKGLKISKIFADVFTFRSAHVAKTHGEVARLRRIFPLHTLLIFSNIARVIYWVTCVNNVNFMLIKATHVAQCLNVHGGWEKFYYTV